jgi:hypothetical protein
MRIISTPMLPVTLQVSRTRTGTSMHGLSIRIPTTRTCTTAIIIEGQHAYDVTTFLRVKHLLRTLAARAPEKSWTTAAQTGHWPR